MAALKQEMEQKKLSILSIQIALNCTEKTARSKVNGKSEFTFAETMKIRDLYFPGMSLEYLFGNGKLTAEPQKAS